MSGSLTHMAQPRVSLPALELYTIAAEYVEAGRLDAASRLLGHILADLPEHGDGLHLRGMIAFRKGRLDEAAASMERAMRLGHAKAQHWRNLSEIYRLLSRLEEAAAAATRAVTLEPAHAHGHFNLAMVEYDRMRIDAAIAAARAALERNPKLPEAHMKLGQSLLLSGQYRAGWEHYEWRYQIPGAPPLMPATDRRQWDGTPMPEQRLLLIADQGYGDVIMFGRFIAWAQARCPRITLACSPEIRAIAAQLAPAVETVVTWEACQDYAAFLPLSGLPRLAGIQLSDLPHKTNYLTSDPDRVAQWKSRLDAALPPGTRRIALAWAGRPTHNNDRNRSIPLSRLHSLAQRPNTAFLSLQKGPNAAECVAWPGPAPLLNLDAEIASFEDSAAILSAVDLLISVDTSMVHLAGALGRPAWAMLPYAPDWRWLIGRTDTPWYPSVRLFRQTAPRDWDSVIRPIAASL